MRYNSKLVWIGIALLLALTAVNTYTLHQALQRVANDNSKVQHTQQLLLETERLKSLLVDAETGQRGFLYTHNPQYLAPYQEASETIDTQADRVQALVAGDSQQLDRLQQVRQLSHKKLEELGRTIELDKSGSAAEARTLVLSNVGKSLMDEIRQRLDAIAQTESERQGARVQRTLESTVFASRSLTATTVVSTLAVLLFGWLLSREMKKSRTATLEVAEQREWLNTTLHSIGDAVIATDEGGRVVFLNEFGATLTGYKSEEAKGLLLREVFPIFHETTRLPVEDPVERVIRMGTVVGLANHTILRRRDGTEIAIDDSAAPIRNLKGELIGVVLVFRDVTRQRKVDSALRSAEKLATAGRFAATVAHEINNPLEAVVNSLYLLNQEPGLSQEGRRYLQMAEEELSRVAAVARQTLAFYKDSSSPTLVKIPVLLEEILSVYRRRLETRGVRVVRDYDDNAACVCSAGEMRQVFSNLILNSLDALRPEGTLTLRAKNTNGDGGPGICVEVEDTGEGIAPENLDKIFEPFFTTKKDVGTGLGLWSAKNLVEKSGGTLDARSDTGITRFIVRLPANTQATINRQAS